MKKTLKNGLLFFFLLIFLVTSVNIPAAGTEEESRQLTILFTHDMHDQLLPLKDEQDGVIAEMGGYARLFSAILAEKQKDPDAIVVDAGDFSMGTPFQTIFKTHAPGLRLMGKMGYDAVTFGNHEYDYRPQGLADSLNSALERGENLPPIVQANVNFPAGRNGNLTPSLKNLKQAYEDYGVKDYCVIERKGVKVGIFGLMGVDAAIKAPMAEVEFTDPIRSARRVVKELIENEKAELIICLPHSGTVPEKSHSEDVFLAQKVPEIDVIISGHTHRKLSEPILVGKTIIASAEKSGKYLGVIKISQNGNSGWKLNSYHLQPIDGRIPENSLIAKEIAGYKKMVDEEYFSLFDLNFEQIVAFSPINFNTVNKINEKHAEEPLGNLISDAFVYAVKEAEGEDYVPVDAAIVPAGTVRSTFFQGYITAGDVFSVSSLGIGPDNIPGYPLISVYLTGKELKTACEVDASIAPFMKAAQLFMSGLNYTFNPHRLIFNKVTDVYLERPDGTTEEIDEEKLYRVVAGLYTAQMLSVVGDKSLGLFSIVPKTREGTPITDFEAHIIKDKKNNAEVKEWWALCQYLQSFEKVNGVPQIPKYYGETHGRKVVDNNKHPWALLNKPNGIALAIYAVGLTILMLISFLVSIVWKKTIIIKKSSLWK